MGELELFCYDNQNLVQLLNSFEIVSCFLIIVVSAVFLQKFRSKNLKFFYKCADLYLD